MSLPALSLRQATDADTGLIVSSWLHSNRFSRYARILHPATYTRDQRAAMTAILQRCAPVVVRTPDDRIAGWLVGEPKRPGQPYPILHYVWTRPEFRRCGLARMTFEAWRAQHAASEPSFSASHATDTARAILGQSTWAAQYFQCTNSHHMRFCLTLAREPTAFVAA